VYYQSPTIIVSIVPLLLAVVAGQEGEQRSTHESRSHFRPAVARSLNGAIEVETSHYVLFLAAVCYYSFFFYFVVALLSELVGLASVVCVPVSTVHRSSR
jgi:hypothetical protein